jgi:hypothetical protein
MACYTIHTEEKSDQEGEDDDMELDDQEGEEEEEGTFKLARGDCSYALFVVGLKSKQGM